MTSRGLGCIPDHASDVADDLRDRHVGLLVGADAPTTMPLQIDYSPLLGGIPNQGRTNSCVGQALATSIYLRAQIAGSPIARPSAKAIYDIARLVDTPGQLKDVGSRPRAAIQGIQENGLVADERWPLSEENVNELPPLDVFRAALAALLSEYYRIASGVGASTLIRMALSKGFCPTFVMPVDDAYDRYDGRSVYRSRTGPSLGLHMQAIVGYIDDVLLVAGSWGGGFGLAGYARIANEFFDSGEATDILVPTVVPSRIT